MNEFILFNKKNKKLNILEGIDNKIIKGIIIHIHGLGSHFQPLYDCIDELPNRDKLFSKNNFKSYGLEFHGHGKSEGTKCSIYNFDDLLDDLDILIKYIENIYSYIPIFIFAESMGCSVAIKYCITRINKIKGLIFLAPLFGIDDNLKPNNFTKNILLFVSKLFPNIPLLKSSNTMTNIASDNNDFILAKEQNKYTYHGNHRLCTGRELLSISDWIKENGYLLKTPILIFHGLKDCITQPLITKDIFNKISSQNKQLYLLDDAQHCLLIESYKDSLIPEYIITKSIYWLEQLLI